MTGHQQQEENCKKHKHVETQQHATKQPMDREEIKEKIWKYLEANDNKDTILQNQWDAAKAVLRGQFIAIQAHIRKQEKAQINKLTLHLKILQREEQTRPKVSRRKEVIKIRAEINDIETRKTRERIRGKPQSYWKERNHKDQSRNKWGRNEENRGRDQWN